MAQLMGHLTRAAPELQREVVEKLLKVLDQQLEALGPPLPGLHGLKYPGLFPDARVDKQKDAGATGAAQEGATQATRARAKGRSRVAAGQDDWSAINAGIDLFTSDGAQVVPTRGNVQPRTTGIMRQRLRQLSEEWVQRAHKKIDSPEGGWARDEVRRMAEPIRAINDDQAVGPLGIQLEACPVAWSQWCAITPCSGFFCTCVFADTMAQLHRAASGELSCCVGWTAYSGTIHSVVSHAFSPFPCQHKGLQDLATASHSQHPSNLTPCSGLCVCAAPCPLQGGAACGQVQSRAAPRPGHHGTAA